MYESTLSGLHGLESEALLMVISRKDAELAFLSLAPLNVIFEVVQCSGRVWNMVVCVVGADVECRRKLSVTLETKTFIVTRQSLAFKNWIGLGGIALHLLFDVLAFAGDDDLCWAWLIFFTRIRSVARIETRMTATNSCLGLATSMWTMSQICIFTLSWAMTALLAGVNAALQALLADLPTRDGCRPAGLVLEDLLTAHASLLNKVWALRTGLLITVAVMLDLWMSTSFRSLTLVRTWRWSCAAWLWRVKHSASAITGDLLEDCLPTTSTSTSVAEILAKMLRVSTSQRLAASARTDVLSFELLVLSSIPLSLLFSRQTC